MNTRRQRTLKKRVTLSGIGMHTGEVVTMTFCPAAEGEGVTFQRMDLKGRPIIPATIEYVQQTARSTTIGIGPASVHTIEHVLAAFRAYDIDNVRVELSAAEPPIGDGSSSPFVDLIEKAGIEEQEMWAPIIELQEPVYLSQNEIHLVALPSEEYRLSYTLYYPDSEALKAQYFSTAITPEIFKEQIAPCRTFALYDEVAHLMDRGLIKGGSLENAVVVKGNTIFSKEGLKFSDEMVRHKVLDLLGDLSLLGFPLKAHIMAVRSGHSSNVAFAKVLFKHITMEKADGRHFVLPA